jgi:tellurite resistance-related uncharacterized protein
VRTAGPFDAESLPLALRQSHVVGERTLGCLQVKEGTLRFTMATEPPIGVALTAGDRQPIPPGVPHQLTVDGRTVVAIDFLGMSTKVATLMTSTRRLGPR